MTIVRSKLSHVQVFARLALASTFLMPFISFGQDQASPPSKTAPDNSARNKSHSKTADQQSEASSDRMITKKIRQALIADDSLSMYGHNVKIITRNGMVTLKGPVHSDEEKQAIGSKAAEVLGSPDKVTNNLSVKVKR